MTISFPDVSQYTKVSLAGAPVALARATISNVKDSAWDWFVANAQANRVPLLAYSFLNAGSLGVSPEAQAEYAFSVIGSRPTMLDHEPNRNACASLSEACRWIDRFRSIGGVTYLDYMPKWSWSGTMGGPGLGPLADRGMLLVSSNYTAYSDTGPGWAPYYPSCPVPIVQWQYSSTHQFNGFACDWNAFRGTVDEYLQLAGGEMADVSTWQEPYGAVDENAFMTHHLAIALLTGKKPKHGYWGKNPDGSPIDIGASDNNLWDTLTEIKNAVTQQQATGFTDAQVTALGQQLSTAVIAAHPALGPDDEPAIQEAVKNVLRAGVGS